MGSRWIRLLVVAVAVAAFGQVAAQEDMWPPLSESLVDAAEEWFGSPTERAAQGLPRLLMGDKLDDLQQTKAEDWTWIYLPSTNENIVENKMCRDDVSSILKVFNTPLILSLLVLKQHFWPMLLPDSWGKMPDGVLYGNTQPWGMMEECTGLHVKELIPGLLHPLLNTTFNGKYCAIAYSSLNTSFEEEEDVRKQKTQMLWGQPPGVELYSPVDLPFAHYGTCMPSSCTEEDLRVTLDAHLKLLGKKAKTVDCQTEDEEVTYGADDIAVIVILSIFGFLLLAAAIVDISINHWDQQQYRNGPLKFLLVFSAYTNMKKIFTINNTRNPEVISCLHGIRVLSMVWVVWGHTYFFIAFYSSNLSIEGLAPVTNTVLDETIDNATFSVDTFFFMSGLLVAFGVLKEFSRVGRINWIMFYIHRFIRLAPPIALTAIVAATIPRLILFGPMSKEIERTAIQSCKNYWWGDMLFVTNFLDFPCLGQCWYTAVDTQIYIFLPLVFLPLLYRRKIGIAVLAVVTAIAIAIPTIISAVYHVPPLVMFAQPVEERGDVDTYMTPWCRANSYLVGVWAGLLLFTVQGKILRMKLWQAILGWLLSAAVALAVLYGMADYDTLEDPVLLPVAPSIIYAGFSRASWCAALVWVVFACHTGYGGPINTFLSHPSWQPMSRLTFAMYLTCFPIQMIYPGLIYIPFYINHLNSVLLTCGFLFIGGIAAVLLSLMVEGPILGLEKILLRRPGRGIKDPETTTTQRT